MSFSDHFSRLAANYATYRPNYPSRFFGWLAGQAKRRRVAWDCATGNGQAAVGLAEFFAKVEATDASPEQIAHAIPRFGVEYRVAPADASGLQSGIVDLVTVAQALHWFDHHAFFAEARRVLAPGGAIAVWSYMNPWLTDPVLDAMLQRFTEETIGPWWPPERAIVLDGYRTIDFPFAEVAPPPFTLVQAWTLAELAGYLRTWSGTARYVAHHGHDPVDDLEAELGARWGDPVSRRLVRWPIALRVGHAE